MKIYKKSTSEPYFLAIDTTYLLITFQDLEK